MCCIYDYELLQEVYGTVDKHFGINVVIDRTTPAATATDLVNYTSYDGMSVSAQFQDVVICVMNFRQID